MISPVSGGKISPGTSMRGGEEQPVAMQPVVLPFLIGAEIGDRGFDLDDPDFAGGIEGHQIGAAAGGSGNSATQEKPNACNSREVPRAIASAVSDWRPSTGICSGLAGFMRQQITSVCRRRKAL